jgi:hypothetical protein
MPVEPIVHSFSYSLGYLREQVADLSDRQMTFQPEGVPNHPAWTIGHLVFIAQAIGGVAGLESWLNAEWVRLFGPGSTPISDAGAYPSKETLLAALNDAEERLADAIRDLDEAALDRPFPDPAYKDIFPTVRHAFTQVLIGHTSFHVGQISVWRRAVGLVPMSRSFE